MEEDQYTYTRMNRFEKKRKGTKTISLLVVIGGLLVLLLIGMIVFNTDDKNQVENVNGTSPVGEETENASNSEGISDTEKSSDQTTSDSVVEGLPDRNQTEREPVPSEDENVMKAFTSNWQPVGTVQEGPHVTTYEPETQDWKEMMEAVRLATGLTEDDMIEWWVQRGGDQQAIATVSNRSETEIYRVYVSWVDQQGWMPTLVERLKENDQKYRFENNSSSETPQDSTE